MKENIRIHSVLLLVTMIYGGNYAIAKLAMPAFIQPFGFIVVRVLSGTTLFWILHRSTSKEKITSAKDFRLLLACGVFGVAANQLLFFKGLNLTSPINASIIMTMSPIIVLLTAYILGRETITAKKALGVLIGASGTYLLITKDGASFENEHFLGDFLVLLNATSYAIYLVLVKPLMAKYEALTVIKWVFLMGSLIVTPIGFYEFMAISWTSFTPTAWFSVAYVVLGTTFLAYLLNAWSLRFVNSSVVGTYMYLQPVFATIVALLLQSGTLELQTVFYCSLIMSGVYLVSSK